MLDNITLTWRNYKEIEGRRRGSERGGRSEREWGEGEAVRGREGGRERGGGEGGGKGGRENCSNPVGMSMSSGSK